MGLLNITYEIYLKVNSFKMSISYHRYLIIARANLETTI